MTHGVVLGHDALRLNGSSCLNILDLAALIHSLELHQELLSAFLILFSLPNINSSSSDSLSFAWSDGKELLLGTLRAVGGLLLLLKIPQKSCLLGLVKLGQQEGPQATYQLRILGAILGLNLIWLHQVARVDDLLVVD